MACGGSAAGRGDLRRLVYTWVVMVFGGGVVDRGKGNSETGIVVVLVWGLFLHLVLLCSWIGGLA